MEKDKKICIDEREYLNDYNNLLSSVAYEFNSKFAAIASPTLSKQETITFLYKNIKQAKRVTHFKHFLFFIPRFLKHFVIIIYYSLKYRVKDLQKNFIYFRSWLEPRCISENELIDEHFRKLPFELVKTEKVIVGLHPYDYTLLKKIKPKLVKSPFIITLGLLSIRDIISIFFNYIKTAYLKVNREYFLKNLKISSYINDSLLSDYLMFRSLTAHIDRRICKKLNHFEPKAFVYVFENQSWEKGCCDFFSQKKTKCIAIQGSGFSKLFLNFFPSKINYVKSNYPDLILTVGDLFTKFLREQTNIKVPIETFGALRFSYPMKNLKYLIAKSNKNILNKILYAFSVHEEQYDEIVKDLIIIFGETNILIDLKFHPQYIKLKKLKSILPSNFHIVKDFKKNNLNQEYDLVLFNDNSFGLEALIFGIKSFQYNSEGCFIDDRFLYFNQWNTRIDFEGLKKLKNDFINNRHEKTFDEKLASNYINQLYKPFRFEKTFFI
jgi:hypothetical protein